VLVVVVGKGVTGGVGLVRSDGDDSMEIVVSVEVEGACDV